LVLLAQTGRLIKREDTNFICALSLYQALPINIAKENSLYAKLSDIYAMLSIRIFDWVW